MERLGYATRELGVPFPELSADPLEQWQLHEAVMVRYQLLGDRRQKRDDARTEARARAEEWARQRKAGG